MLNNCLVFDEMSSRWPRIVLHADLDAFYAAVEQMDDPRLAGRPLLIGGKSDRGVVLTASYEARPFGVGSAMPMARARQLCPQALVVPPRFSRYMELSRQVFEVFDQFSPTVEALSLDEAFLDMTGAEGVFGPPRQMATKLRAAVRESTGLVVSVGVSGTKYVAKVASDFDKPDGLTLVEPDRARLFLAPLPVSRLWGAGPKTVARLRAAGFETIGQVAAADPRALARRLGRLGPHFFHLARAEDPRPVEGRRSAKSVGSERTLERDVTDRAAIEQCLRRSADEVGRRLRAKGLRARGVRVKLKTASFRLLTRQRRLAAPTDLARRLSSEATSLLDEFDLDEPFRLVGLAAYELSRGAPVQQELFGPEADPEASARQRRLEQVVDRLQERFGAGAVMRAEELERRGGPRMGVNLDFLSD